MGITGLLPFIEKASRRTNVNEFSGCTVAIDSYCWLHKGAFACADKLVRGEKTDVHIRYCLKYVNMLLSKNVKPILVFDGRHLPAKAMTESKRRESRNISKKRAAELLSLGKMEEARSYMRRSVDITHEMALQLIQECRKRNVDCIVAPYEADAQLAYLNVKNIAHLVITEDSDLILFGCTRVLFKMDLEGTGTLVETAKLPLVMKCPIEQYSFDKFRAMCVMSGCDYLASLPGIGLAKARQFVTATQDSNFANALRKLPSFFNRSNLVVTDEYRENFLKAEATFKHQYVYDPLERRMVRLTDPQDEDIEQALCVNAGELLEPDVAFQLALGNLDPFTLKKMDSWHPDYRPTENKSIKSNNWNEKVSTHPSMWSSGFDSYLDEPTPWQAKPRVDPIAFTRRTTRRVVHLASKVVPETEDQDESLSIQSLSSMYCMEPPTKRLKSDEIKSCPILAQNEIKTQKSPSPILENKERSFKKGLRNGNILKKLSRFPRTVVGDNIVESKFFTTKSTSDIELQQKNNDTTKTDAERLTLDTDKSIIDVSPVKSKNPFKKSTESDFNDTGFESNMCTEVNIDKTCIVIEESPVKCKNPFKKTVDSNISASSDVLEVNSDSDLTMCEDLDSSQKENSPYKSPILKPSPNRVLLRNAVRILDKSWTEDTVIENTYPMETLVTPVDSQESFGQSPQKTLSQSRFAFSQPLKSNAKKATCRVPGLRRAASLPSNQPTLLSKFGFQKKPILKR